MRGKKIDYLFIDPFSSRTSGISSYIRYARKILSRWFIVEVLSINEDEPIEEFRKRVGNFVDSNVINVIEVPETRAASKYINHPRLHIRLHGSRTYCNYLQNLPVAPQLILEEQVELNKARFISAPSLITVEIGKIFFKELNNVAIIPNPICQYTHKNDLSKKCNKICFVGRGDYLKGIEFLLEIIKINPKLNILLIGDEKLKSRFVSYSQVEFINGGDVNIGELINIGDIVLVPSLFETWSMVAAEVLSNGGRLVIWEHLGICEFILSNRYIRKIPIWDIRAFNQAIEDLTLSKVDGSDIINEADKLINSWNDTYVGYINEIISNNKSSLGSEVLIRPDLGKLLTIRYKQGKTMRLKKKIIKFFKNPALFFKDSKYFYSIYSKYNNLISNGVETKFLENKAKVEKDIPAIPTIKISKLVLSPSGFITFPDMDEKKAHLRTMILLPERYIDFGGKLIPLLYEHKDFLPLREGELIVYCYDDKFSELDPVRILENLNIKNRERLSNIRNIFVLDDTENFALSIHYCNYIVNVVQIIPESSNSLNISNELGYYLIAKDYVGLNEIHRKYFLYDSIYSLSLFIRKTIQELLPRDINLLLPVISSPTNYRINLFKSKIKNCDIKLYLKSSGLEYKKCQNHNEICEVMSRITNELYVTEQVFLKYQNLLTNPSPDNLSKFYLYSSKDGFYFDVEYN